MYLLPLLIGSIILLTSGGCKEPVSGSQEIENPLAHISTANLGCIGDSTLLRFSGSVLDDWYYHNDSLRIMLRYTANCCSEFRDSLAVLLPEAIAINLNDTTGRICRCFCTHESRFVFYAPGINRIRISCAYKEMNHPYLQLLDTLLNVSAAK